MDDIVFFDLETTGTDPDKDRVVQFAAMRGDKSISLLINPECPIPPEATKVHGVTNEMVQGAMTFKEAASTIYAWFYRADIAGYNILRFDLPLIVNEFGRAGYTFPLNGVKIVDVMVLFTHLLPKTLESALKFFCGEDHIDAHDAFGDVIATAKVFEAQKTWQAFPDSREAIHELCWGDRVTLDGKIRKNEQGEPVIGFGKHKGTPLRRLPKSYVRWMLKSDFSAETKGVIRKLLQK